MPPTLGQREVEIHDVGGNDGARSGLARFIAACAVLHPPLSDRESCELSSFESEMQRMSDDELRCRVSRFIYRLQSG